MKKKGNRKGFTLIELLVVVLIIGILAAVAMPLYRRSVERAQLSELRINMKAVMDSATRYYMANSAYDGIVSDDGNGGALWNLDMDLPANGKFIYQPYIASEDNFILAAAKNMDTNYLFMMMNTGTAVNTTLYCLPVNNVGLKDCKNIGAKECDKGDLCIMMDFFEGEAQP
jgi:prepilin-type N-terminal cleavage/methylation domain-containing protein